MQQAARAVAAVMLLIAPSLALAAGGGFAGPAVAGIPMEFVFFAATLLAVAEAATQVKRANQLNDDLIKTKQDRDDARAELAAWAALGIPVNQVKDVIAEAKRLQTQTEAQEEEIKTLMRVNQGLTHKLAKLIQEDYHVPLPAKLRGTILVADPKWDFVVLNVGQDQGVLEDGELLVNRNGRLVAKVRVRSVQKDRCIANVMPGWKLGDVVEGDLVIPAYPAS